MLTWGGDLRVGVMVTLTLSSSSSWWGGGCLRGPYTKHLRKIDIKWGLVAMVTTRIELIAR